MDLTQVLLEILQYTYPQDVKNAFYVNKETYNNTKHGRNKLIDQESMLIRVNYKKHIVREWYSKCKLKKEYEFILIRNTITNNVWDYSDLGILIDYPTVFIEKPGYETEEEIVPCGRYREWDEKGNLIVEKWI